MIITATTSLVQDNVFNGKIPNRLFFALVDNSSDNGADEGNPFELGHASVSAIQVTFDSQEITPPLRLNYDDDDYFDAYSSLVTSLNYTPSLIDYDRFKEGSAIHDVTTSLE